MKNQAIKFGLYYALINILYSLIVYFINPDLLLNVKVGLIMSYLIPIIFMFLAAKAERNQNNGSLSFGEGFKTAFLTWMVGTFLSIMFGYVLYNFIDPSLLDAAKEQAIEMSQGVAEKFGAPEEALSQMEEDMADTNPMSISTVMIGWFFNLIAGAIIAVIIGAVTKRDSGA